MVSVPAPDPLQPVGGGVSPVPREARPFQGQPAGVVTRLVAAVLDGVIVGFVLLIGYFGVAGLVFLVDPRSFHFPHAGLILSMTAALAVAFCYLTGAWTLGGRTYGYLVMGLRVLGPGGRHLRLPGAAARAALVILLPIGVLWVPVSRGNRSLQDLALRTKVVYDWQPRGARLRAADQAE
jgi:uncharacterized RDD family membrane protein YckC